jgi:DNA-binding protein YbaB
VNPNELMSSYMREVEQIAAKAEEAKKQLKQLSGTLTSSDGAVTVTVNAGGALQRLSFGPRADQMSKPQLAALIMSTARRAQAQAAQQITGILAPLVGENSDAMRFVREQLPVPEEPNEGVAPSQARQQHVAYNEEQRDAFARQPRQQQMPQPHYGPPQQPAYQPPQFSHEQPPARPMQRAPQPPRRDDVDDDFGGRPVTREEDW